MTSTRPAKRPRTSDPSESDGDRDSRDNSPSPDAQGPSSSNGTPQYDRGDLWFEDGNITLVAEHKTAFRVYRGVLERNSEIFRGMFTLPQPADAEKLDGHPVVHLSDTTKDLHRFLVAIFDLGSTYFGSEQRLPFLVVSTMMRLGSKYEVSYLHQEAVRRLQSVFPSRDHDMALWHPIGNILSDDTPIFQPPSSVGNMELKAHDVFAVINLARTFRVDDILPVSFYWCAQISSASELIGGHTDEEGTTHRLSPNDVVTAFAGQLKLHGQYIEKIRPIIVGTVAPECEDSDDCYRLMSYARHGIVDELHRKASVFADSTLRATRDLCGACEEYCNEHAWAERAKSWQKLAQSFDLGVEWPPQ